MPSDTTQFRIGERVRIISQEHIIPTEINLLNDSTGMIVATLTIAPGYYDVRLDTSARCCIVFETDIEGLPSQIKVHRQGLGLPAHSATPTSPAT